MENMETNVVADEKMRSLKTLTIIIYALYAASFVIGVSAIVAIVMNYVKRDEVAGSFLESHFRWQIRGFWFALLWTVVGIITTPILIGWLVLLGNAVWFIYRLVKGFLFLNDNKPMYVI